MNVRDRSAGLLFLVGGVVGDTKDGLDEKEGEENGSEDCVGAAIRFE